MTEQTGHARFTDGPYDVLTATPGAERVVAVHPNQGSYRLATEGDVVVLYHRLAPEVATADATAATLKDINARNREFWSLRTGSKSKPSR